MPLMNIDLIKGKDKEYLQKLLDVSYEVMLDTFNAPEGDRYQILTQHEPFEMQVLDTGLGIKRSENVVIFHLTTRPRTIDQKNNFYKKLTDKLEEKIGLSKKDVMISLSTNSDSDWSFGNGEAQFTNGKLG